MIVNALRIFGWICVVAAALQVFLAAPGETTQTFDPVLRRMVTDRAGWNWLWIDRAAQTFVAAVLWFALAAIVEALETGTSRLGEIATLLREQREEGRRAPKPAAGPALPLPARLGPAPQPVPLDDASPEEMAARILAANHGQMNSSTTVQVVNFMEARLRRTHPDQPLPSYAALEKEARRLLHDAKHKAPAGGYETPEATADRVLRLNFGRLDADAITAVVHALEQRDRLYAPDRPLPADQVLRDTAQRILRDALKRMHGDG